MKMFYSRARRAPEGAVYANPRFFDRPVEGVTHVLLDGDWPKIADAYSAAGAKVERVDTVKVVELVVVEPRGVTSTLTADERAQVFIPDDWRDLQYVRATEGRDITLRGLAAMLSDEPVINKAQAVAAIEAELERREPADEASLASDKLEEA